MITTATEQRKDSMTDCNAFVQDYEGPETPKCPEQAAFAVRIGTLVGRYCGPHLIDFLDAEGEGIIVWPASASDETVLGHHIARDFP